MEHQEAKIQAAIVSAISLAGLYVFAVGNDFAGATSQARAGRLKAAGLRAGVSDLIVMSQDGRAHFLEIKTATGVLSPSQVRFSELCIKHHWPYAVARSVDEAMEQVRKWGLT